MQAWVAEILHSGEFVAIVAMVWMVIARLNRDESIRKDYPPHRHSNGSINYPPDYPPGSVEHIQVDMRGSGN